MRHDIHDLRARIDAAQVYELAHRTPLQLVPKLSRELGRRIWLKREDLQDVFSFKIRGAANRMAGLGEIARVQGVCAASAGNHAQGVAKAAAHYGIDALIFMPVTTPTIKVAAVEALGGKTRLVGDNYDEACDAAIEHSQKSGAIFIHPFDELDVIAGQGTVAKEIFEQATRKIDAIYVCTGGGGLVSGIGAYAKSVSPDTRIVAAEPLGAATLKAAMAAGQPVDLDHVDGFADGVAVRRIGTLTYALCCDVVDDCVTVTNDEICAAVRDIFEATRTVVEPAGAVALAALRRDVADGRAPDGDCVVTVSGANVNFDRIGHMVERAELGAGEEMLFGATIPEQRGAFQRFVEALGHRAVTEFSYRYQNDAQAHLLVGLKIKSGAERDNVMNDLNAANVAALDLSNDRLAKRHLRHMIGGDPDTTMREVLYRVEFPERPGALGQFLSALDARWNISLFHYRNHGAAEGHVLCGFQLPKDDKSALEESLSAIGFPVWEETDNPATQLFL
ncbi:L-threonine dehydratase [Algimonas ampicilliniresistens]|uniref:L-threonine dehydratase n=1 Tax=Algimonas ampicilliniresistens TaxID=1298735 RepID=A0ABQ5VC70_9PROT|nr:threonine ammonia-lyase, biosynthetic [Algimonas ampicilliniresistens]GLQ24572.1 L-threonine dehydratase [Algimonas ampicilliniresistens]